MLQIGYVFKEMITIIAILLVSVIIFLFIEYLVHFHHLKSIPVRIHVNGTRGKSSITRLIAAALREHGMKTYAKTTGTLPRMIMRDGREFPIYRPTGANIIEQLRIVALAADSKADVLVVECMALQPYLQSLTELKFIRSTHGVITNARADHLDVMGPSERDVALALLGTTPRKGILFTGERDYPNEFASACRDRKSELRVVELAEIEAISDEEISGFSYVEHKENVALALKVAESLGVPRQVALKGMWNARPDFGAMSESEIDFFGRKVMFVNGFAANDPESSERVWRMSFEKYGHMKKKIMVLNSRADRPDRSKQLGEAMGEWPRADKYILIGSGVYVLFKRAVAGGIEPSRFVYAEGMKVDRIFEEIMAASGKSAMVTGIGNIGGPGIELVNYFRNRTTLP
ncbi:Capsule biosynthesis protein capB [uncultured Desulfobacterium sp.]|uniref:Capsule biosynthesis protein capB n=1 Tax=uncultured Desulfobacterium sp. TaxID=201089 RepID=A0A445N2Q7_9BACT|nr:Capsule biosynthesis protein capB [uncultured Desulfobacterium sp.]